MKSKLANNFDRMEARLALVRLDITHKQFSQIAGVSNSALSMALTGHMIPTEDFASKVWEAIKILDNEKSKGGSR